MFRQTVALMVKMQNRKIAESALKRTDLGGNH